MKMKMNMNKKRWLILGACCLINLCLGSIYAWSVFSASMSEYLSSLTGQSITSADLAIVYTVANSVGPITMITGGWFNDKFGPKKVLLAGTIMYSIGLILSGFAVNTSMLLLTYGIIGGLGLGMAYGCTISTAVKYFPDKRGLIGGVTTAVYGLKLERNVTDTNFLCHDHFTDLRSFQWHDDYLTGSRACTGNGWND